MKQIGKKLTLVMLVLLSVIFMFLGVFSIGKMTGLADTGTGETGTGTTQPEKPETPVEVGDETDWYHLSYSSNHLELLLDGDYKKYLDGERGDLQLLSGKLMEAIKTILMTNILRVSMDELEDLNVNLSGIVMLADEGQPTLPGLDLSGDYSDVWNDSELLQRFRDRIYEELSKPEELEKYLDGEYDVLLKYAIGSYVEHKGGELTEDEQKKVSGAIQEVVTSAKKNADQQLQNQIDELRETNPEKAQQLQQQKNELNNKYEEQKYDPKNPESNNKLSGIVQEAVEAGGVPQITVPEIVGAFTAIKIDGQTLYAKEVGEDGQNGVNLSTLRSLLGRLPKPGELANYTEKQFKEFFKVDSIVIETTFGDIEFSFTFGFKGDTTAIKNAAAFIARYFDVVVDGNSISIKVRTSETVTRALKKLAESTRFTDKQKNLVFSVFGMTVDEMYGKVTSYSFDEVLNFLKSVDYKHWFAQFMDAEYLNGFCGEYLEEALGRPLVQQDIYDFVDKVYGFFAKRLSPISEMTVEEVEQWLKDTIPGFSKLVKDPAKVTKAADALLKFAKKVDWDAYDAKAIRELLNDPEKDVNGTIYGYIDDLRSYEEYYDQFLDFVEKLYHHVPESFKDGSIVGLYKEDGKFSYAGHHTVDVVGAIGKAMDYLIGRGWISEDWNQYVEIVVGSHDPFDFDLSVELSVPHLHKVSYKVNGEVVREGFLPEGVNGKTVAMFSDLPEIEGHAVLGWLDAASSKLYVSETETNYLAAMPDTDVTLVPVTDFTLTQKVDGNEGAELEAIYSATATHTLSVDVLGAFEGTEYTYQWYKGTTKLEDKTDAELVLKTVAESGDYTVVVTDPSTGYFVTSKTFTVKIEKQVISATAEWTVDGKAYDAKNPPFYNMEEHRVEFKNITVESDDKLTDAIFEKKELAKLPAGQDRITVSAKNKVEKLLLTLKEESFANYAFEGDQKQGEVTFEWNIQKLVITFTKVDLEAEGATEATTQDDELTYITHTYTYKNEDIAVNWVVKFKTNDKQTWELKDFFNPEMIPSFTHKDVGTYNVSWPASSMGGLMSDGYPMQPEWTKSGFMEFMQSKVEDFDPNSIDFDNDSLGEIGARLSTTFHFLVIEPVRLNVEYNWLLDGKSDKETDNFHVTFDGKPHTMSVSVAFTDAKLKGQEDDYFDQPTLTGNVQTNASNDYNAEASEIVLKNKNYVISTTSPTSMEWVIDRLAIAAPTGTWKGVTDTPLEIVADGNDHAGDFRADGVHEFQLAAESTPYFTFTVSYKKGNQSVTEMKAIGDYTVSADFSLKTDLIATNYSIGAVDLTEEYEFTSITLSVSLVPDESHQIDLSSVTWTNVTFTYDAQKHEPTPGGLSQDVLALLNVVYYNGGDKLSEAPTNHGSYTAVLEIKNPDEYAFKSGTEGKARQLFTINRAEVKVDVTWDYNDTPFAFGSHTVTPTVTVTPVNTALAKLIDKTDFEFVAVDNEKSAAGTYTAYVTITLKNDNYQFQGKGENDRTDVRFGDKRWEISAAAQNWPLNHQWPLSDGDVTVEITEGDVSKDLKPTSKAALLDDYLDQIKALFKEGKFVGATGFEIHFEDASGTEQAVSGKFKISLKIPENLKDCDHLYVVHIHGNTVEQVSPAATKENDFMVFYTSSFSIFAVVGYNDAPSMNWWLLGALTLIALLLLIALIVLIVYVVKMKPEAVAAPAEETAVEEVETTEETETSEETGETEAEAEAEAQPAEETEAQPAEEAEAQPTEEAPAEGSAEAEAQPEGATPIGAAAESAEAEELAPVVETMTVYDKSFTARLSQAEEPAKSMYNDLKNYILSYKFVRSRISWGYDSFSKGREKICKLQFKGKSLFMYIALDPNELDPKYHHKDVSDVSKYEDVPTKLKVRSARSLKYAKIMVDLLMQKLEIEQGELENNNYTLNYRSTEQLIADGEIKVKEVEAPEFWNMDANDVVESAPLLPDVELPEEEGKEDDE